jgi:hypothetical protein
MRLQFAMYKKTLILLFAAACTTAEKQASVGQAAGTVPRDSVIAGAASATPAPATATTTAVGVSAAPKTAAAQAVQNEPVRALYVNRWATQSRKRMTKLIAAADSTEINALVLDMKDEFGLNYKTENAVFAKNAGTATKVANLKALLDTLKAHNILAIARLVVFKDSVTARVHPDWTIRRQDGSVWRDKKGLAWVNPYHHALWDYNIGVAEELVKLGFGEIQFDYIRFPEPYPSLPQQVFPDSKGVSKPDVLAAYLKEARERLNKLGARSTADIFGLVTTVTGPLEVGQHWEKVAPVTDVLLPMVYPSHYPRGSFGIAVPNKDPYQTVKIAITKARERDQKLGIKDPDHIRPWIQAFSLYGVTYGAAEVEAQKKAIYESGCDGWVLWNPGSIYDVFMPALEKTFVSRRKS